MRLPFEEWFSSQGLRPDAIRLFAESVVCFKAGAYRASLLFSYLAFQSTIRDRILAAAAPLGYVAGHWSALQAELRDDGVWDTKTFDTTQNRVRPVFSLSDDLRKQVEYWRDRRNDCAHSKSNEIGAAHVESFWMFVQSNLAKIVVIGSAQSLLERIERHFDPTFTAPGTDPLPLAADVSTAVEPKNRAQFLQDVVVKLSSTSVFGTFVRPEAVSFFEALLRQPDPNVQAAAVTHLSADEGMLVDVLRSSPSKVLLFSHHPHLVRRLWTHYAFSNGIADFPLYASLIRNGLIPQLDVPQAHALVVSRMRGGVPSPVDADTLVQSGLLVALDAYAFRDGNVDLFSWGNPNAAVVRWRIENYPISDVAVATICSKFAAEPCAHQPRDALNALFSQNPSKKEEFKAAATRLQLELPALIPALTA